LSAENSAEVVTLDDAKAHYLLEIIKHISKETEMDTLNIGLLGENKSLFEAIQQKIKKTKVNKKLITVHLIDKQSSIKNYYSVVFVVDKRLNDVTGIINRFGSVLIVVDGRVDKEAQFVNLLTRGNRIIIGINRENLVRSGFEVSNNLLSFAGTKEDLTEQLNEQQAHLTRLVNDAKEITQALSKKNIELAQIKNTLKDKNNVLSQSIEKLSNNRKQLSTLQEQKRLDKKNIDENKNYMLQQKKELDLKNDVLLAKEESLKQLNLRISNNNIILEQQNVLLKKKSEIINKKEQTINGQRTLLFVAISAILIISIFVYITLRLFRLQKKANKELSRLNEQLYELATTDSMTQLFNRRHFIELAQRQINQLIRTKEDGAMLMLDIDHFKNVNDTYGHAMGDEAITCIATLLKANLREYDVVGRVGGEEYAMLLAQCEFDKALQIAERIREKIAELSITHQHNTIKLTMSIGLTMLKKEDKDIDKVLQRADEALYKAKSAGRNRVVSA